MNLPVPLHIPQVPVLEPTPTLQPVLPVLPTPNRRSSRTSARIQPLHPKDIDVESLKEVR